MTITSEGQQLEDLIIRSRFKEKSQEENRGESRSKSKSEISYVIIVARKDIEYFSTYEQINGGNVLMENDASYKSISIDIKNLISLDTLEANGCKYLRENELDQDFWVEAVSAACHLVNRSPTSAINFKAPKEVYCPIYVHVNDGKLEPRVKKCTFLGYASRVK
ncbi:unnamed protein product [Spirodela intermedia]|uniref:Retroviral polymerase SH3-like domain-containing protein n=1 Tax=Spirodela intermedia TaxID=51605 RepID=A0A7I8JPX3_SPIIN|nr:unnamed protein product [Spirodela intermedia]CAA6672217.1 unnamed protein product [Spirodela intermedia]